MTFGKSPEERIGQGIFAHVGENLVVNLESREIGCGGLVVSHDEISGDLRELVMASSEKASIGVGS